MLEFHWNAKNEAHIARHRGVTPQQVEEAASPPRYITDGVDGTKLLFGRTFAGEYLVVVMTEAMDGRMYVITARRMEDHERELFHRRSR